MKKINWQIPLAVVWLILAGGAIRVWGWPAYNFSPDDVMHLHMADQPGWVRVWFASMEQLHPPLLYLVYHAALKVGRNAYWLRSVSLAAGLSTMVVLFFLGRKFIGDLAGVVAVGLFAFSYGNVLMDQVIRHYSLLLLFLSLALWFFLSHHKEPRSRYLWGFSVFSLLAVMTHYSGVIALAGMGVVWLGVLAAQKRPRAEYLKPVLAFAPTVLALGYFFGAHVAGIFSSGFFGQMREDYLKPHFASSFLGFAENLQALFGYLFLPPAAPWLMAAAIIGLIGLIRRGPKVLAAAGLASLSCHVALNLLHKYPLGGGRHGLYFFPFAALAVGAGAQWSWDWLRGRERWRIDPPGGLVAWVRGRERAIAVAAMATLFLLPWALLPWLATNDFLRRYQPPSWMEFPLTEKSYLEVFEILQRERMPGDVVLTNGQTSHYLFFITGRKGEPLGDGLIKIEYRGLNFYFEKNSWTYDREEQFMASFHKLRTKLAPSYMIRVWLLNLGWGQGFPARTYRIEKHARDGGNLSLLEWQQVEIMKELDR